MTTIELKAGDRVAMSRAWLRSTGTFTGEVPFRRGTVRRLEHFGGRTQLAWVDWDGGSDSRVLTLNLVRVDRIPFEPV